MQKETKLCEKCKVAFSEAVVLVVGDPSMSEL
jgi:hypothetical protein